MRTAYMVGLVFFIVAYTAYAQVPERPVTTDRTVTEQQQKGDNEHDLLVEGAFRASHSIAAQLAATDRVELLLRLANAAGKKRPEKAKNWALEALRLANEMRPTAQRAQYEVEALRALAAVDSEEALAILPGLEVPASAKDDDPRVKAAPAVFQEFLSQHPDDWEKLPVVAQRIGDAGNYPFQAIQVVISRIGSKDPETAAALMRQAIHYYNLGDHGVSATSQMAMLLAEHSKFVPGSALKATLETMISSLVNTDHGPAGDLTNAGAAGTEDERLRITMALLMPVISSFDPEMERKLKQEHPILDSGFSFRISTSDAVAGPQSDGPAPEGSATGSPAASVSVVLQDSKAQTPPMATDSMENSDSGDTVKIILTPSPEDSTKQLDQSEGASKKEADTEQKLQALVERGISLAASERPAELPSVLADAFALGEKLFRKSLNEDPQAGWNSRPGASDLSNLVEAVAKAAPHAVLERIRNMYTSALQAQLYVSFVEGMQSEQESVVVMKAGN